MPPTARFVPPAAAPRPLADAPAAPASSTPGRRAGSIRRTSHVDVRLRRTDGGPHVPVDVADRRAVHGMLTMQLEGGARDLWTGTDGASRVLGLAGVSATADTQRLLTSIETTPPVPGLEEVVGEPVREGFRRRTAGLGPPQPLALLLFDLPGAALISGYTISRAMFLSGAPEDEVTPAEVAPFLRDVCTGWDATGAPYRMVASGRGAPHHPAPLAPDLTDPADPEGWHVTTPPPPGWMRRRRRLDVVPDGHEVVLDVHFRDSHVDPDGTETVVHEYTVGAWLDRGDVLRELAVTGRVLPYGQCTLAPTHADVVVGTPLDRLDALIRERLSGTRGCTHLNDVLTSLVGLGGLVATVRESRRA